jgi:DegV family protein with EDD domain
MSHERKVSIISDSSAAIPKEIAEEKEIEVIPAIINFGKKTFKDGVDIDSSKFLELLLSEKIHPTTSAPNPTEYAEIYRRFLPSKMISINLGGGFSSMHKNSISGAKSVDERKITPYDSESVSMGTGFMAIKAADLRDKGKSREEILEELDVMKKRTFVVATFNTMKYLAKGGRAAVIQQIFSALDLKPVLRIDSNKMNKISFPRKREDGLAKVMEVTKKFAPFEQVGVVYSGGKEDEEVAKEMVDEVRKIFKRDVYLGNIGAAVSTHAGPGAIATVFVCKK